jgi:hypothetical protein
MWWVTDRGVTPEDHAKLREIQGQIRILQDKIRSMMR